MPNYVPNYVLLTRIILMKRKFAHLAKSGYVGGQCKTDYQTKKGSDKQTDGDRMRQIERERGGRRRGDLEFCPCF